MASSPSSMSGRRNRPGCMSAITHLFDFNQAVAGKKLLTDKKYGTGTEPEINISDVEVEQFISKTGNGGKLEFVKSASVSRRSGDVPIKSLIAKDISQDVGSPNELKSRTPGVVARLMGLDALPCDIAGHSRETGELENSVQKVHSDRIQHAKFPVSNSSRVPKNGGPPTRSVSDLSSCRRSSWEEHTTTTFESLPTERQLHEKEFKIPRDCQTDWTPQNRVQMQTLDELDVQLATKQMLIKTKLGEAKQGILEKNNASQEKLYESREFMDAMDFLQANKDFFARFLGEPDSLFAKHLKSSEEKCSQIKEEELRKHAKQYAIGIPDHGATAQIKDLPESWRSPCRDSERTSHIGDRASIDGPCRKERLLKTQQKHVKSSKHVISLAEEGQQSPTRIVVLKPGPGKARNLRSLTPGNSKSPKEFLDAIEIVKENSLDVLRDLRCKLQQEDAKDLIKTWPSVSEHSKMVKDPREIAREIARQVRESVMKDMQANPKVAIISREPGWDKNKLPSEVLNVGSGGISMNNKGSLFGQPRDLLSEQVPNVSSQLRDKSSSPNRGKGDSRRSLEQIFLEKSIAHTLGPQGAVSWRHPRLRDYGCHHKRIGQEVGGPAVSEANSFYTSDVRSVNETDMDCDLDSRIQSVYESDADTYARNENLAHITLLRSRSVPASALFYKKLEKKGMIGDPTVPLCEASLSDHKSSADVAIHQTRLSGRSISRRKHLGRNSILFKGNTLSEEIPMQELTMQKCNSNVDFGSEKLQHQIDDSGPVLDSDSSVSSIDNCLNLKSALMTEGKRRGRHPGTATCTEAAIGNTMLSNSKSLSPEESPNKSLSSPDVEHMSADCEGSKDLPEQPSPVSVLDVPYHEEPASPVESTETSSHLQELGVRFQLLNFEDQEVEAVPILEEYPGEDRELTDEIQSATNHLPAVSGSIEDINLLVDGISCPRGKKQELLYVQKLLIASCFTIDSAAVFTQWHSPSKPLSACVFEAVENGYRCECSDTITKECGLSLLTRHLLFDSVNEVLLQVLGPYINRPAWWKCPQVPSNMPLGEDLVQQVWSGICKLLCLHSEDQDTLGSLVANDLATKDRWRDLSLDIQIVMLGVEKAIWNDMLEDTFSGY